MMSKAPNASGRERDLAASGDRGVHATFAQVAERLPEAHRARRARVRRRQDRAADIERDPEVGRGRATEDGEGQVGRDLADALLEVALVLRLGVGDATERRAEVDADALGARGTVDARRQLRVLEREATGDHRELAEPVELTGRLRGHPVERIEVVDLGRDLAAER